MRLPKEDRLFLAQRIQKDWPKCQSCQEMIALDRLLCLPYTNYCVKHSKEGRYIGVPNFSHKTAPEVAKVKADPDADDGMGESVRQLMRGYHRSR